MLSTRHALEAERTARERFQVARDSMEQELRTSNHRCAVMQAALDGKTIQLRYGDPTKTWLDCLYPLWDWKNAEYRVKPEEDSAQHASSDQCCGRCKWTDKQEKSCPAAEDKEEQSLWLLTVFTQKGSQRSFCTKRLRCSAAEAAAEYALALDLKSEEAQTAAPHVPFYYAVTFVELSPFSA